MLIDCHLFPYSKTHNTMQIYSFISEVDIYSVNQFLLHWCRTGAIALYAEINQSYSLNFHGCLHIGHSCFTFCCDSSHFMTHCICSAWPHCPHTGGQSSPGYLTPGQHASKGILHIPQTYVTCINNAIQNHANNFSSCTSSSTSHFHTPTPCQRFTATLISTFSQIWTTQFQN